MPNFNFNTKTGQIFNRSLTFYWSSVSGSSQHSAVIMPAKKESGPPPKPKPEELIAEFKEKFENFSIESNKQNEELDEKIVSAKESLSNLEQINENNYADSQVKAKELLEEINESIEHKFKQVSIEIQESFQNLEKQLRDGMLSTFSNIPACRLYYFQAPTGRVTAVPSWTCWRASWRRPGTSSSSLRTRREAT